MNRPKRKTYVKRYGWEHTERYIQALETYSHYLEKALDRACELIASVPDCYWDCPLKNICRKSNVDVCTKDGWKEWAMKDE